MLSLETADHAGRAEEELIDFTQLVADMARKYAPDALREGLEMNLDAPEHALNVRGNSILLREAVENLLDNALRYGSANGGALTLALSSQDQHVRLVVEDDGPGIPAAASEQVFERFLRLPRPDGKTPQGSGCGLGLAIVRSIATAHGGATYLGEKDKGCRVIFDLPLAG